GVDVELQRRMAERLGLPAPSDSPSAPRAPNIGAPTFGWLPNLPTNTGAPIISAPNIGPDTLSVAPGPDTSVEQPTSDDPSENFPPSQMNGGLDIAAPNSGARHFDEPEFDLRDLLIRRTSTKSYVVHSVSRIEDVFTSAERDLLKWLWERGRP